MHVHVQYMLHVHVHVHVLVFQNVLSHMSVYSHWNIAMSSTSHSSCNPEQLKLNHCGRLSSRAASVAQLVESLPSTQNFAGSSPA